MVCARNIRSIWKPMETLMINTCIQVHQALILTSRFLMAGRVVARRSFSKNHYPNLLYPLKLKHKRISGVKITTKSNFSYILLAMYMPCDNFSKTVNQEYVDVVNAIKLIFNSKDCNRLIVCRDFNTSFSRNQHA